MTGAHKSKCTVVYRNLIMQNMSHKQHINCVLMYCVANIDGTRSILCKFI